MNALDRVEAAKGGPFTYRVNGEVRGLPSPAEIPPLAVLGVLEDGWNIYAMLDHKVWHVEHLRRAWQLHHDLPDAQGARRLLYLVDRYADDLEYDLRAVVGEDLGALFRARRWRYLLNLIDRLPGHSYYAEAVANDEEHAEMIAKAEADREARGDKSPKWSPPLRTWTTEVDMLARVLDAVNALKYVTIVANSDKSKPPTPEPTPRPKTAIEKIRQRASYHRKLEDHKKLVSIMLPHKKSAE